MPASEPTAKALRTAADTSASEVGGGSNMAELLAQLASTVEAIKAADPSTFDEGQLEAVLSARTTLGKVADRVEAQMDASGEAQHGWQ